MTFLTTMLVLWLLGCIVAAAIADNRNRSPIGFFLLALFFSPLIGVIAALISSPSTPSVIINEAPRMTDNGNTVEDHLKVLERLVKLKDAGVMTEEEFNTEKHRLFHSNS